MLRTSLLFFLLLTVGIVAQEGDYGDYPDYQDYAVDDYGPVQDDYGVPQDTLYHDYAQRQNTKDGYVLLTRDAFQSLLLPVYVECLSALVQSLTHCCCIDTCPCTHTHINT